MKITRRDFVTALGAVLAGTILGSKLSFAAHPEAGPEGEFALLEKRSGGRLGIAVHDTRSGLRYGYRRDERFPMCSTFKVLACGAVLARVDAGSEELSRRIRFAAEDIVAYSPVTQNRRGGDGMTLRELCEAAMTQSDNTAANLILASLGGPSGVTRFARSIGDAQTRLDHMEPGLNKAVPDDPGDSTTPAAMAANLHALVLGDCLSPGSRNLLATWLVSNQTGGARLRAGLPGDWRVGDKTGSGDRGTTNDIGVAWPPDRKPLVLSVYLTGTRASADDRNATIAAVARVVATHLKTAGTHPPGRM